VPEHKRARRRLAGRVFVQLNLQLVRLPQPFSICVSAAVVPRTSMSGNGVVNSPVMGSCITLYARRAVTRASGTWREPAAERSARMAKVMAEEEERCVYLTRGAQENSGKARKGFGPRLRRRRAAGTRKKNAKQEIGYAKVCERPMSRDT
jgi:hypothetical protein